MQLQMGEVNPRPVTSLSTPHPYLVLPYFVLSALPVLCCCCYTGNTSCPYLGIISAFRPVPNLLLQGVCGRFFILWGCRLSKNDFIKCLPPQLCLCILLISLHEVTLLHNIISATGVVWGCLKVTVGITAILKELKPLVWVFLIQNVPEVVYLIYLLYTVIREWGKGSSYTLEAAFITGSCISVAIKSVLFWALLHVYRSFGQGLRERMFSSYGRIDS
uniref:DUF7789 domain-containing protein n=1 Tax=Ficedula albicollis TaxID=59894 RepID=A0A803V5B0_FICAL